jgi:4-hydroxy-tetrahydrodipicolinate synthase
LRITGCLTALATPFCAPSAAGEGAIDFDAWSRLVEAQRVGGTHGVVVAGSTGEGSALDDAELHQLIERALKLAGGMRVIAGTGLSNTRKTVALTRSAARAGAEAALVVAPPYVRPTQEGLYAHYMAVAEGGDLPVVLYNVPARTACDLLPATVARLARHPRIIGIKEARAEAERMEALLPLRDEGFTVLSGDDPTCGRAMLAGADGVISVASNVAPAAMRRLSDLARAGRADAAAAIEAKLAPLFAFLGVEPNPIPLKALLAGKGLGSEQPRLPLTALSADNRPAMEALLPDLATTEFAASAELSNDPNFSGETR